MANDRQMENIAKMLSKGLGKSSDKLIDDMKKGDVNSALENLSSDKRSKINSLLSDPELSKKLMADKNVQEILRKLDL